METTVARRRFTVRDYQRMIEAGILGEDDRVELIDGDVLTMAPIGPRHAACVKRLTALFAAAPARDRFVISVQDPVALPHAASQPEPDVALLVPPLSRYADRHPEADDLILVIEVADTSLEDDRTKKIPVYARAGVREAWLVDLQNETVERHQSPSPTGYTRLTRLDRSGTIAPAALPDLTISITRIFA